MDDKEVCAISRTKCVKPLKAKAEKANLVDHDQPLHLPQFNRIMEEVELLALMVETTPHLFHPFIYLYRMGLAVGE